MSFLFIVVVALAIPVSSRQAFHLSVDRDRSTGYLKESNVACARDPSNWAYATLLEAKNACKDCPINDDGCTQGKRGVNPSIQRFWPCKRRGIQTTDSGSCVWFNQTSCDTILISSSGISRHRGKTNFDYKKNVFGTYLLKYWDAKNNAVYQRTNAGTSYYLSKNSKNNWKVRIYSIL